MSVLFQQVIFKSVTKFVDKAFVILEMNISKYLQINVFSIIYFNFYSTIFIEELHVYMLVDVSDLSDVIQIVQLFDKYCAPRSIDFFIHVQCMYLIIIIRMLHIKLRSCFTS